MEAQKGGGVQGHSFPVLTQEMTSYQLYMRLSESQDQTGRVGKILPPTVFGLRTVCPVVSLLIYKNNTYIL